MSSRRVASLALCTLLWAAMVAGLPATAQAEEGWCAADADCPLGESCVSDRCWPLSGGVPERCVSFVEGGPDAECRKATAWLSEGATTCEIAGGSLDAQLMGDSCGTGTFRSALNVCCVADVADDADVVNGTNVGALRARIEDEALNKALGCNATDEDGGPVIPVVLLATVLSWLFWRREC